MRELSEWKAVGAARKISFHPPGAARPPALQPLSPSCQSTLQWFQQQAQQTLCLARGAGWIVQGAFNHIMRGKGVWGEGWWNTESVPTSVAEGVLPAQACPLPALQLEVQELFIQNTVYRKNVIGKLIYEKCLGVLVFALISKSQVSFVTQSDYLHRHFH